jgi:hypothetical protein
MDTITWRGQTYRVGSDPAYCELPLPDWIPTVLPAPWQAIALPSVPYIPGPAYARAYAKHGTLRVLLSAARYGDGKGWLHVSVSRKNREVPSWAQMCEVKDLFIGVERTAVQVHPPRSKYVNMHPGCLHLWCCLDGEVVPDFTAGGDTI